MSELADWFLVKGHRVMERGEIAGKLTKILNRQPSLEEYYRCICETRKVLERKHRSTLYNVKGVGYKLATKTEEARFAALCAHRTILLAERTRRLLAFVDKRLFVAEFRTMLVHAERGIESMYRYGRRMIEDWGKVTILKVEEEKENGSKRHE